jgi:hypothetical protein
VARLELLYHVGLPQSDDQHDEEGGDDAGETVLVEGEELLDALLQETQRLEIRLEV